MILFSTYSEADKVYYFSTEDLRVDYSDSGQSNGGTKSIQFPLQAVRQKQHKQTDRFAIIFWKLMRKEREREKERELGSRGHKLFKS